MRPAARRSVATFLMAAICLIALLVASAVRAEEVMYQCSPKHIDDREALDWSVTGVGQAADDSDADPDATGSFDLIGHRRNGGGLFFAHVEGSTGQSSGRVSGRFPLSNADAATAVDEDGDGRIQISQLSYTQQGDKVAFAVGLLDPTCYLDVSAIANDETMSFMAAPFVNNLSVAFPDYTLGGGLHLHRHEGLEATFFLSSSNGLGDNDRASYSNLFDITDSGKGIFATAELSVQGAALYRLGFWANTRDFEDLGDPDDTGSNYGVYGLADGSVNDVEWNVRLGVANPDVSETAGFAAVATAFPWGRYTGGLAVSYLRASGDLDSESSNSFFAEASLHIDFGEHFRLTPLVQLTHNDSFTSRDALLVGLRGTYLRSQ